MPSYPSDPFFESGAMACLIFYRTNGLHGSITCLHNMIRPYLPVVRINAILISKDFTRVIQMFDTKLDSRRTTRISNPERGAPFVESEKINQPVLINNLDGYKVQAPFKDPDLADVRFFDPQRNDPASAVRERRILFLPELLVRRLRRLHMDACGAASAACAAPRRELRNACRSRRKRRCPTPRRDRDSSGCPCALSWPRSGSASSWRPRRGRRCLSSRKRVRARSPWPTPSMSGRIGATARSVTVPITPSSSSSATVGAHEKGAFTGAHTTRRGSRLTAGRCFSTKSGRCRRRRRCTCCACWRAGM